MRRRATGGVRLSLEQAGSGTPIVLLHGLTATRRYVVMGSRALERSGHRRIAYDARGHGHSSPAHSPDAYTYELLAEDLRAVLDRLEIERAVLAGASMGAQTALRFALDLPERVLALGLITPAFDPDTHGEPDPTRRGTGSRKGSEKGGSRASSLPTISILSPSASGRPSRRCCASGSPRTIIRLQWQTPCKPSHARDRSRAGRSCAPIEIPTVVIASRDEADPTHPLATGERYAAAIPGAKFVVEDAGPPVRSPIAWQGGQLSKVLAELATSVPGRRPSERGARRVDAVAVVSCGLDIGPAQASAAEGSWPGSSTMAPRAAPRSVRRARPAPRGCHALRSCRRRAPGSGRRRGSWRGGGRSRSWCDPGRGRPVPVAPRARSRCRAPRWPRRRSVSAGCEGPYARSRCAASRRRRSGSHARRQGCHSPRVARRSARGSGRPWRRLRSARRLPRDMRSAGSRGSRSETGRSPGRRAPQSRQATAA